MTQINDVRGSRCQARKVQIATIYLPNTPTTSFTDFVALDPLPSYA
jgi:hypothetical protein